MKMFGIVLALISGIALLIAFFNRDRAGWQNQRGSIARRRASQRQDGTEGKRQAIALTSGLLL